MTAAEVQRELYSKLHVKINGSMDNPVAPPQDLCGRPFLELLIPPSIGHESPCMCQVYPYITAMNLSLALA